MTSPTLELGQEVDMERCCSVWDIPDSSVFKSMIIVELVTAWL